MIFTDEFSIEMGESGPKAVDNQTSRGGVRSPTSTNNDLPLARRRSSWCGRRRPWEETAFATPFSGAVIDSGGVRKKAEGLNGPRYSAWALYGQLSPMLEELRSEGRVKMLVVEDGAPAHSSKVTKAARIDCGISTLHHPRSSPVSSKQR